SVLVRFLAHPILQFSRPWRREARSSASDIRDPALRSRERRVIHRGHVSADHLPAQPGKTHPCLALAADQLAATHLELEVDGGEVATERQDLQADALVLDPRPWRPRDAMGVNLAEAVAVLAKCVPNRVRAVPESGV